MDGPNHEISQRMYRAKEQILDGLESLANATLGLSLAPEACRAQDWEMGKKVAQLGLDMAGKAKELEELIADRIAVEEHQFEASR